MVSDYPGKSDWYQASDGLWYPPQTNLDRPADAVAIQYWNPAVQAWLPAWSRVTLECLGLDFDGTASSQIWIPFQQLTSVEYRQASPSGGHEVAIAYRSASADQYLLLWLPDEQWGRVYTSFNQSRVRAGRPESPGGWGSTPATASIPATPRPKAQRVKARRSTGSGGTLVAVLLGAVLLVVGALLPWASAETPFATLTAKGVEGDGVLTLGAGLLVALLITLGSGRRGPALMCVIVGLLAGLVALVDMSNLADALAELEQDESLLLAPSIGVGLWLTAIGAGVVVVGSLASMASDT